MTSNMTFIYIDAYRFVARDIAYTENHDNKYSECGRLKDTIEVARFTCTSLSLLLELRCTQPTFSMVWCHTCRTFLNSRVFLIDV